MAIEKLDKEVSEQEFQAALISSTNEFSFEIKGEEIYKDNEKYRIEKIYRDKHKYGEGGYRQNDVVLWKVSVREDKVLEARNYVSWYTYSDDSADFPEKEEHLVTLYKEDKLARAVFERLKNKKNKK